jgi:small subunit ribosomal protein S7
MSRRKTAERRPVKPDLKYSNQFVTRLIKCIMRRGEIDIARKIVYSAFDKIEKELNRSPLEVFHEALQNVRPLLQVRSKRVGGATYPVPMEVRLEASEATGLRWIAKSVRKRICRTAIDSLAKALIDSSKGIGDAMEERKKVHATADANKAFINFRW